METDLIVIGGGVCGLYAALRASREGKNVLVLEGREVLGGLAAGNKRGANYYDLGVHMLHAHDKEVYQDCRDAMGDERVEVSLDAKIRWAGSFYRYPLQFGDMVRGMNPFVLARCVVGLFYSQARYAIAPQEPIDAEQALIQLYGKPLYRFFFESFTEQYWEIHPREISADFVKSKMPKLSAVDVIKRGLAVFGLKSKHSDSTQSALAKETLHYSANGAEALPRRLGEAVRESGAKVLTSAEVDRLEISPDGDGGSRFCVHVAGDEHGSFEADRVISTMPVNRLIKRLDPAPAEPVFKAADSLQFRAIAIYGLLVKRPKILDALYIYYRDRAFHRVGEPKNAGLKVTPEDHTVLIVETTCTKGDPVWNGDENAKAQIFADLEAEGICTADEVVECHVLRNAHGYPIYAKGYEAHICAIQNHLETIPGLISTGRNGGFRYPNMHIAMRMGADAVDSIFAGDDVPATLGLSVDHPACVTTGI